MAPRGMAFGRPLRHSSWRKLPVRQRLTLEACVFASIHPPAASSLSVFWHNAHVPQMALTARADCGGLSSVCLNAGDPQAFLPALSGLLWCSGLIVLRDTDDTFPRHSICTVPIPPDFAGFEDDPEFQGMELPPILAGGQRFELTLGSTFQTARGGAVLAMGMVAIHTRLLHWLYGVGEGIYETGRVFIGTFLPPTFIEGAFLDQGLFFHRSTGLLPTFIGNPPWIPAGPVSSHVIRIPYLDDCAVSNFATVAESRYAEIDARARALRGLLDRAENLHASGAVGSQLALWESEKREWEQAQLRLLEDVREEVVTLGFGGPQIRILTSTLTVTICSRVPGGGAWVPSLPDLEQDIRSFASTSQGAALRRGPFSFATLAL